VKNSRAPYVILFAITLAFRVATALPLQQAGYMDASYTMHIAEQLARGQGFAEQVLWNYLDNPAGLPHPSNLYWMPLPALLVAPLFALFGVSYRVAQIPFILLSSLVPLVAFYVSRKVFARDEYAWASALLTTFSGFFTIYWVSPDNFTVFALVASVCLYLIARGIETNSARVAFLAGLFAGLSHLTRADGLLLLVILPLGLLFRPRRDGARAVDFFLLTFALLFGYLLVMTPWFIRNLLAVGTPLPSAGTKTIWLTNYDELFRYADDLTPARYFASGIGAIIGAKANAALQNFFILIFSGLVLFLAPFTFIGWWQSRRRVEFLPYVLYTVLLFCVMTFVFTFPSWRGTLFHSMSALVPFFAIVVPPGIDTAVQWIARRRRAWQAQQAASVFRWGFVAIAAFFSVYVYASGVFGLGAQSNIPLWNVRDVEYVPIARWLDTNARVDDIVLVVDPPGFYNVSHRRAIVIPTDSVEAVFAAAQRYGARYLVLQFDHPAPLNDLYRERTTIPGLTRVADFNDGGGKPAMLFEVTP
jgi:hypothetical protein